MEIGRAVDLHSFFADPDTAVFLNADPDPDFLCRFGSTGLEIGTFLVILLKYLK